MNVRRVIRLRTVLLMLSFGLVSTSVLAGPIVGGYEWRQLTETTGLNHADGASVCDLVTGACNGVAGGVDLTGWTWANTAEVTGLFRGFSGLETLAEGDIYVEQGSSWAPAFMALFDATFSSSGTSGVSGYLRDLFSPGQPITASLQDSGSASLNDRVIAGGTFALFDDRLSSRGLFLFRDATGVPAPATWALVGVGLVLLRLTRKQR